MHILRRHDSILTSRLHLKIQPRTSDHYQKLSNVQEEYLLDLNTRLRYLLSQGSSYGILEEFSDDKIALKLDMKFLQMEIT